MRQFLYRFEVDRAFHDAALNVLEIITLHRNLTGHDFIERATQCKHIGPGAERLTREMFRRHVAQCPGRELLGFACNAYVLGEAEVHHARYVIRVDQYVARA